MRGMLAPRFRVYPITREQHLLYVDWWLDNVVLFTTKIYQSVTIDGDTLRASSSNPHAFKTG
jgi:hypothetical protein